MQNLYVHAVRAEMERQGVACRVDNTANICFPTVVLMDVGVDDNTFVFMIPIALQVGIAQYCLIVGKTADEKIVSIQTW